MNLKTYKCRNKNNISPIVNVEFDPKKMVKDPEKLYEPRVQAFEAIKMHLDNVEQASATWLHNRSVNAIENLSGAHEMPDYENEIHTALRKPLNQVSSRNLKTNLSRSPLSKFK
jgi:hypothetical protein